MRADELMIGDWVFHYVGGEEKIKPVQVIGISFDGIQGVYQKGDEILSLSYDDIMPMSIDVDILERNGWVGAGENMFVKQPYRITKAEKVWGVAYGMAYVAEIRYVHELQNIMRMTGYQGGFKV